MGKLDLNEAQGLIVTGNSPSFLENPEVMCPLERKLLSEYLQFHE
jgi:hypothetical protein